jgi:acyl carrier protein
MERNAAIRAFIRELLASRGDMEPFSDAASLLQSGRLQSIDAIELVVFLEENYGVDFATTGLEQAMLESLDGISALVEDAARRTKPQPT